MSTSVLVVDDDAERRAGVKRLLAAARLVVAGEADFGGEAAYLARELHPDLALVSLEEPLARSLKTVELLTSVAPEMPVVAISSLNDKEHVRKAMLAGARDFLGRPCGADELAQTLSAVVEVEQKRRALARDALESGHKGEILALFSGKGGSGRTSIATNLAAALALDMRQKQKVVLVDLDLLLGDVAVLLDLAPERTIADLVPVVDKLDPELMRGFLSVHSSGLKVLPAPLHPEECDAASPQLVRKVLEVLARTYDYVVVDLPRSLEDWVVVAMDLASLVLLVTTYELACLKSTRICLDMMRRWRYSEDKLKLVINYANRVSGGFSAGEAEAALDYPIFWKIPSEPAGLWTSLQGLTLVQAQPGSRVAQNFRDLAAAVGGAHQHRRGLFARVAAVPAVAALRLGW